MLLRTLGCRRTQVLLGWYFAFLKWRVHFGAGLRNYRRSLSDCKPIKSTSEIWVDAEKWMQFTAAGKSLISGLYIGWPFFRSYMGDGVFPVVTTLSKFGGPFLWGSCLVLCAGLILAGLRCGSCPLQRIAVHLNLLVWGAMFGLLLGTLTPGLALPLGAWVIIDEWRRLRRLGKERRSVCPNAASK